MFPRDPHMHYLKHCGSSLGNVGRGPFQSKHITIKSIFANLPQSPRYEDPTEQSLECHSGHNLCTNVSKVVFTFHPFDSNNTTGHRLSNRVVADRQMLLLQSRFRDGYTFHHGLIEGANSGQSSTCAATAYSAVARGSDSFITWRGTDDVFPSFHLTTTSPCPIYVLFEMEM